MQKHSLWNTLIKDNIVVTNQISINMKKETNNSRHIELKNEYQGDLHRYISFVPLTKLESLGKSYIRSDQNQDNLLFDKDSINLIIDDHNENFITEVLSQIDPAIIGWVVGMRDTIRIGLNNEKRRLLNLMGYGVRKVFALLSSLYHLKNGALLIYEIENRLHYKSIDVFIRVLYSFVKEFPKT